MKTTIIFFITFTVLIAGCSFFEKLALEGKMEIESAGYKPWSEPPAPNSDVPERGTDLAVIVENWHKGANPLYIVYQNRKSFRATITDDTKLGVVINARIVRSSSVLKQTSEKVNLSDRLVYETKDGEVEYLRIEEWKQIDDL